MWRIEQGDCLDLMRQLPDNSVDLIVTDPPYFRMKSDAWDHQWTNDAAFFAWIGECCDEWQRLLKPNGSLYCFASPHKAWGVEGEIRKRFTVLNRITWNKGGEDGQGGNGRHRGTAKEDLRAYFPVTEVVFFAEHIGADNAAKGEAGYLKACDKLRGFVFEPLRAYLDEERKRAGVQSRALMDYFEAHGWPKYVTARHSFSQSQWELPTKENYERLRQCLNELGSGSYLRRYYEDLKQQYEDLKQQYEDLKQQYEDLRRPFNARPDAPYTDVWTFPTVPYRPGKHPCEKPLAMLDHIIAISGRPPGVVLDPFLGSGSTAEAAVKGGFSFIGFDKDERYVKASRRRLEAASIQPRLDVA